MTWKAIRLESGRNMGVIQEAFSLIWMANGAPFNAAMYCTRGSAGRVQHVYFSPDAAKLFSQQLISYSAFDTPRPTEPVTLLVGHDSAKSISSIL